MQTDNIYTPPLTRTIQPPKDHRRHAPNGGAHTDADRMSFFTNFNEDLIKKLRVIKNS